MFLFILFFNVYFSFYSSYDTDEDSISNPFDDTDWLPSKSDCESSGSDEGKYFMK